MSGIETVDSYCRLCGTQEVLRETNYYNTHTGDKQTAPTCPNTINCEAGCRNNGGHFRVRQFTGFLAVLTGKDGYFKCTRCGDRYWSDYR